MGGLRSIRTPIIIVTASAYRLDMMELFLACVTA